ncbi:MAG: zinc transporter ZupT [Lentisphaerae bacterium]|nr:zinc transporter ZupT [Lentisphaerota bacterium]
MTHFDSSQLIFALLLTAGAGIATALGGCIAFFFNRSNHKFLSFVLGLSAGVMIYISLVELLAESRSTLISLYGHRPGAFFAIAAFFAGIAIAMMIDKLIPSHENPHEFRSVEEMDSPKHHDRLLRSGTLFALAVGIHNFPEGMAVFISSLADPGTGISIAIAVAIHNIPEGITVSVPVYHATGSRKKAFLWSLLSGLAEPLGALAAWLILAPFLSQTLLMLIFASVSGIMIYISFDELLPLAEEYGEHHTSIAGVIIGMLIMAVSLAI